MTDPFSAMDQAKAKEDFESAFASFKNSKAKTDSASTSDSNKAVATFNSEFPPISELERDDDSDSSSDKGGFDDDFSPSSPKADKPNPLAGNGPATSTAGKESVPGSFPTSPPDVATPINDPFQSRYVSHGTPWPTKP